MSVSCILYKTVRWLTRSPKLLFHMAWEMTPGFILCLLIHPSTGIHSLIPLDRQGFPVFQNFLTCSALYSAHPQKIWGHGTHQHSLPSGLHPLPVYWAQPCGRNSCFHIPQQQWKGVQKTRFVTVLIYPAVLGLPLSLRMWLSSHSSYIFHTF